MAMLNCSQCTRSGFASQAALEDHAEAVHTFGEIEELVRDAVKEQFSDGDDVCYVRDVAADYVVYVKFERTCSCVMRYCDHDSKRLMLKVSYSISDDGTISFGEPEEVRHKSQYVPVPAGNDAEEAEHYGDDKKKRKKKKKDDKDKAQDAAGYIDNPNIAEGHPKTDLPHEFRQDEGSHSFFCSECGRSRPHPLHNPPLASSYRES